MRHVPFHVDAFARAVALAGAFSVVLAGCGGDDGGGPPSLTGVSFAAPTAAADSDSLHFTATVAGPADTPVHWDFGDGSSADGSTADHAYAAAGTYMVVASAGATGGPQVQSTQAVQVRFTGHVAGGHCLPGAQWCWQNALGAGSALNSVSFVDATHAWASADAGEVAQSADGGLTWSAELTATASDLVSVHFQDPLHGAAAGADGSVVTTADGGQSWTATQPFDAIDNFDGLRRDFLPAPPDILALSDGHVSHDGGTTWTAIAGGLTEVDATGCWFADDQLPPGDFETQHNWVDRIEPCGSGGSLRSSRPWGDGTIDARSFSVVPSGRVFQLVETFDEFLDVTNSMWTSADGGATWTSYTPTGHEHDDIGRVQMADDLHGWASAGLRTVDGGHTWATFPRPAALAGATELHVLGASDAWLRLGAVIGRTRDAGATWQVLTVAPEAAGPEAATAAVIAWRWSDDGSDLLLQFGGRLQATHDGGVTWQQVDGADPRDVGNAQVALRFLDARRGMVALPSGALRRTVDGGRHWSRTDFPVADRSAIARLLFPGGDAGWLVQGGVLRASTDAGASWTALALPGGAAGVSDASRPDATHAWLLTTDGRLFASADAGATWTSQALPAPPQDATWRQVAFRSATSGVLVASNGDSWYSADGGATWTFSHYAIAGRDAQVTVTANGDFWIDGTAYSHDGGAHWAAAVLYGGKSVFYLDATHGWIVGAPGRVPGAGEQLCTVALTHCTTMPYAAAAIVMTDLYTGWIATSDGMVLATATGALP